MDKVNSSGNGNSYKHYENVGNDLAPSSTRTQTKMMMLINLEGE